MRTEHFDPGNGSQKLAPTESFEASGSTSTTGMPGYSLAATAFT